MALYKYVYDYDIILPWTEASTWFIENVWFFANPVVYGTEFRQLLRSSN